MKMMMIANVMRVCVCVCVTTTHRALVQLAAVACVCVCVWYFSLKTFKNATDWLASC